MELNYKLIILKNSSGFDGQYVILLVDNNGKGTCIYSTKTYMRNIGKSIKDWNYSNFREMEGDITIKLNPLNEKIPIFSKTSDGGIIMKIRKRIVLISKYEHGHIIGKYEPNLGKPLTEITFKKVSLDKYNLHTSI